MCKLTFIFSLKGFQDSSFKMSFFKLLKKDKPKIEKVSKKISPNGTLFTDYSQFSESRLASTANNIFQHPGAHSLIGITYTNLMVDGQQS
jgi:hypothetical protein